MANHKTDNDADRKTLLYRQNAVFKSKPTYENVMGLTSNKKTPISTETAHKTQHVQPLPIIIEEQREPKNLAYYQGLKFVKKLMGSYDTNVSMMENNIVKKVYFRKGDGPKQFANEVATLIYLLKCDFVPNILAYDSSELAVYMNYINGKPKKNSHTTGMLEGRLAELSRNWGIHRNTHYHWSNVIGTEDKLYLVDFGSVPIKYNLGKSKWRVSSKVKK